MQRHPILSGKEPERPRETSAAEVFAALAQVVVAILAFFQARTTIAWGILAFGALWFLVAFRKPLGRSWRRWRDRKHDDRASRGALPDLQALVRAFGKLVDPDSDNTLQAQLRRAFEGYGGLIERLNVPTPHVFHEMLGNVQRRLDDEPSDKVQVLRALDEFYTVIGAHSSQCIEPVFRSLPKDVREMLKPESRAAINSYRERYVAFHSDFSKFTEGLTSSTHDGRLHRVFYVFRPDALS